MSIADRWLLPDGVEEVLPPAAAHLESVRRKLLDRFDAYGYELVITPMVEYLESLLTGTGSDLDLKTFKITDQITGRTMGIRADITPQVARIDAHSLGRDGTVRLCYAGTVVHANADNMLASRTPIAVGAELFGDGTPLGDLEIISLMYESVTSLSAGPVHLELGDVGILRALLRSAKLDPENEAQLFELIQKKALGELKTLVATLSLPDEIALGINALPDLFGGTEVIAAAREQFSASADITARLDTLATVADGLLARFPDLDLYYDLSELRGYAYHTGIVFAAYDAPSGERLAKGGRYDDVGEVFGRARAATGFDIDLKRLAGVAGAESVSRATVAMAPLFADVDEAARWAYVCQLRAEGYRVVESDDAAGAEFVAEYREGKWALEPVAKT